MELIISQFDDLRDPNDGGMKPIKINKAAIAYYYPHRARFTKIVLMGVAEPLIINTPFEQFSELLEAAP